MTAFRRVRSTAILAGTLFVSGCQPEGYHSVSATREEIAALKREHEERINPARFAVKQPGRASKGSLRRVLPGRTSPRG